MSRLNSLACSVCGVGDCLLWRAESVVDGGRAPWIVLVPVRETKSTCSSVPVNIVMKLWCSSAGPRARSSAKEAKEFSDDINTSPNTINAWAEDISGQPV